MCKTGLCSHPIIENEILENGTSFDQTTVYTCKKYNRRAVTVTSPPHNYLQEVLVIMNANSDGKWHAPDLENNLMLKLANTCYVSTLPAYVLPIYIANGLQEIANTVITGEDEDVMYTMLVGGGHIDSNPLHELVKEACGNGTILEGQSKAITREESENLRGGGIVFTDGTTPDNVSCVLQTAHAMLNPATGCVRWPNLGSGEKIAVHSLYTAVTSVDCMDSVNCTLNICLCSDIVNITSFIACTETLTSTPKLTYYIPTSKPWGFDIVP